MFSDEDKTMENVQKPNICAHVPSSQTFGSYLHKRYIRHMSIPIWNSPFHLWCSSVPVFLSASLLWCHSVKTCSILAELNFRILSSEILGLLLLLSSPLASCSKQISSVFRVNRALRWTLQPLFHGHKCLDRMTVFSLASVSRLLRSLAAIFTCDIGDWY
jgi:hypothetical protein